MKGSAVVEKRIELFVPGRLCLFGEHSDWAGMYKTVNSSIDYGEAIVTGVEQGIYAVVEKNENFIVESALDIYDGERIECPMDTAMLKTIAQQGGFFSYVAGTASYINDNYSVGGVKITVTRMDLPIKSGLSSSAAICVLVARAFNQLYHLKMNIKGEMQAAFRGEQRTPSRCGRLDQACAYGVKPVKMIFNGEEIDSEEMRVGAVFHWVIANLMSSKDTIRILSDLSKCYPFAQNEKERLVQQALGKDNQEICTEAIEAIADGDAIKLGQLMIRWQDNFDKKVMPASDELRGPVLHSVLNDPVIKSLTLGAKGVGSQGDGSVQFLVKDLETAEKLQNYLLEERGMPSYTLTITPGQVVHKAVIPLAGFGTRIFPATKAMKKGMMPVVDNDGLLKPALFVLLEHLNDSGIDEIALIIGEGEQEEYEKLFSPIDNDLREKLPEEKQRYADLIEKISSKITYVVQKEKLGFGHAVWLTRKFSGDDPVLLLLGDFIYKSNTEESCCSQIIDAFMQIGKPLVSITETPLDEVVHYGIIHGKWEDSDETIMKVDSMVEKPTDDYAQEYLGVKNSRKIKKYYKTFGQYVLTREVYDELETEIKEGRKQRGEFQLTSALDAVRNTSGLYAYVPNGKSYDLGLPEAYRHTVWEYNL